MALRSGSPSRSSRKTLRRLIQYKDGEAIEEF
jgi:hypothetical protein